MYKTGEEVEKNLIKIIEKLNILAELNYERNNYPRCHMPRPDVSSISIGG